VTQPPPTTCDHHTCYTDDSGTLYEICANAASDSSFSKTPSGGSPQTATYGWLPGPPPGSWPAGVTFAVQMQSLDLFPPICGDVKQAEWTQQGPSSADVMQFHATGCAPVKFDERDCPASSGMRRQLLEVRSPIASLAAAQDLVQPPPRATARVVMDADVAAPSVPMSAAGVRGGLPFAVVLGAVIGTWALL
jgi:hypothetical protein